MENACPAASIRRIRVSGAASSISTFVPLPRCHGAARTEYIWSVFVISCVIECLLIDRWARQREPGVVLERDAARVRAARVLTVRSPTSSDARVAVLVPIRLFGLLETLEAACHDLG